MIKINNKYLYKGRTVVVIQYNDKRKRVEVSDNLDLKNPFWIDEIELEGVEPEEPKKEKSKKELQIEKLAKKLTDEELDLISVLHKKGLTINLEIIQNIIDKHRIINILFEQGKEIPEELTKNFITFPLNDGQDIR